ncbi:hypothetical protein L9F63_020601, partial [Diploptera punctata]
INAQTFFSKYKPQMQHEVVEEQQFPIYYVHKTKLLRNKNISGLSTYRSVKYTNHIGV